MAQYQFRQFRFANLGWRGKVGLVVAVALGLALAIALVVLSLGLALILIPIVAIAALIGRWRLKKAVDEAKARGDWPEGGDGQRRVIDADYVVIKKGEADGE